MLVTLYCSVISDYVRLDTIRVVSVCSSMWETTTRKIVKLVKLVKNCTKLQKIVRWGWTVWVASWSRSSSGWAFSIIAITTRTSGAATLRSRWVRWCRARWTWIRIAWRWCACCFTSYSWWVWAAACWNWNSAHSWVARRSLQFQYVSFFIFRYFFYFEENAERKTGNSCIK